MQAEQVITSLSSGGVGVLATDTVYGLVCSATHKSSVARLYALKAREKKPGTLVAANIDQLIELGIPKRYLSAVSHYWPNPLSVVIPLPDSLAYLHQSTGSLAVRIPSDPMFHDFLSETGPLLTSSANQPGQPPATNVTEARAYFGDSVDFYLDGGTISENVPSTIIRIVDDSVEVIRHGAVPLTESGEIIR